MPPQGSASPISSKLYGEDEFRKGERRVIARLLDGPAHVLSIGGGAFMDDETRESSAGGRFRLAESRPGHLLERAMRRDNRPLLQGGDPGREIDDLLSCRTRTDLCDRRSHRASEDRPVDETVDRVVKTFGAYSPNAKAAS